MLPKRVRVHGSWWAVVVRAVVKFEGRRVFGLCDPETQTLYIERGPEHKMLTHLRHEVFHAAIASTGFGQLMAFAIERDNVRAQFEELLNDIVVPAFLDTWVPIVNKSENARANPRTPGHTPAVRKRRRAK